MGVGEGNGEGGEVRFWWLVAFRRLFGAEGRGSIRPAAY